MVRYLRVFLSTGHPAELAARLDAHRAQVDGLSADGRLLVAGELQAGDGFFDVLQVDDRHEAERLTRSNPLVEAGLVSWSLRPLERLQLADLPENAD